MEGIPVIDLEEIKSRINPQYADRRGSESHERKMLCDEIEALRQQLKDVTDHYHAALEAEQVRFRQLAALRQQLREKDAEIAHWKNNHATEVRRARILKERTDMPIERVQAYEKWGEDQQQLAASQALTLPADTTALSAIVTKAGEVMQIRAENTATWNGQRGTAEAIRALPTITLDDIK